VQEREEKQTVSLQLDYAQEPKKKFMREESGSYINSEELTTI
jgi:hypothetical protein